MYFDREHMVYLMVHVLFVVTNHFTRKEQILAVVAVLIAYDSYLILYESPKAFEAEAERA